MDLRGRGAYRRVGRAKLTMTMATLALMAGLMVATGVALAAGGSTCQQYNPQTCNVVTPPTSTTPPAAPTTTVTPPTPVAPTTSSTPTSPTPPPSTPTPPTPTGKPSVKTPAPVFVAATTTASATTTKSALPFTGLDLGLILLVAMGLIGGGLVVRRMSRRVN